MCGISLKDRRTNEELRRLVGVEPITTFIRSGRLRWYGHVMRKGDEDWVKKCMEYRVEGRRPVGRPRKTWLESVEVDMAELEIDKEDVHDRSKWRRIVNVMKKKSNPIGKRTINRLYILNKNKAPGVDRIHPSLLRELSKQLSGSLSILFRRTLDEGTVPADWRAANVTPLYKKGIKVFIDRSTKVRRYEPYICCVQGIGKYHQGCHYGALRTTQTD